MDLMFRAKVFSAIFCRLLRVRPSIALRYCPDRSHSVYRGRRFSCFKPSDLIPELQGRFPIRVELESLTIEDFKRILTEPRNALIKQYHALLNTEGLILEFTPEGLEEIAATAVQVNDRTENIGARRLFTIMERLLEHVLLKGLNFTEKNIKVDADYVKDRFKHIVKDEDLSRFIL